MERCDLHTHSTFSDGSWTPAQIIAEAGRLGLAVALTDHNTVSGLAEFVREAEAQGVPAVPGIEISTVYEGTELHLLGLFIEPAYYEQVGAFLREARLLKEKSNRETVERLCAAGYHIEYDAIKGKNPNENVNRAHIAAELLEKGYVASVSEAFATLLDEAQGYYIPPKRTELFDAIALLRKIRAIPVLAHPLQELEEEALRALLPKAMAAGLLGIETLHSSYTAAQKAAAERIAEEFGLAKSGGSDFHGSNKPDIELGTGRGDLAVPVRLYRELLALKAEL